MNTIDDRIDEVLNLAKQLKLLSTFTRSKSTNEQIRELIQVMDKKLQTIWVSTVEFNTGLSGPRKEEK